MIRRFKDFKVINELKHITYRSASAKLKKLGHEDRSARLQKWSYINDTEKLGKFNMNFDLINIRRIHYTTKEPYDQLNINPTNAKLNMLTSKIVKKGPFVCYFVGGHTEDPNESSPEYIKQTSHIGIMISMITEDETTGESFEPFYLSVSIKWDDDSFTIVKNSATIDPCNFDYAIKFSDRNSALRFRNIVLDKDTLLKNIDQIQKIKEFFMEYSNAEEWNKFFEELQKISINSLYFDIKKDLDY